MGEKSHGPGCQLSRLPLSWPLSPSQSCVMSLLCSCASCDATLGTPRTRDTLLCQTTQEISLPPCSDWAEQEFSSAFASVPPCWQDRIGGLGARAGLCPALCSGQGLQCREAAASLIPALGQFWTNPCGQVISSLHHVLEHHFQEQESPRHRWDRDLSWSGFAMRKSNYRLIRNLNYTSCDSWETCHGLARSSLWLSVVLGSGWGPGRAHQVLSQWGADWDKKGIWDKTGTTSFYSWFSPLHHACGDFAVTFCALMAEVGTLPWIQAGFSL